MKTRLLNTALANMTGALALTIMLGAGVAMANDSDQTAADGSQVAVQDSVNENGQINKLSRNTDSFNNDSTYTDNSVEQEAERGGMAADTGGENVSWESESEYDQEASQGGQLASKGSENKSVEKSLYESDDHSFEQEAERGGLAANNEGSKNEVVEYEKEFDQEASEGGQLANRNSENHSTEIENETELEASEGGQLANNGSKNISREVKGSHNDESMTLTVGNIAVVASTQELEGATGAVFVGAEHGSITSGDVGFGENSHRGAAGNITGSNNTGIGTNALSTSAVQASGRFKIGSN